MTDEPGATNSAGMISGVSRSHPALAFDFAIAHIDQVSKKVDSSASSRYYPMLASNSLDPAMVGKVKAYADAHVAAGSRRDAETVMASITYRVKVRNERLPVIDAWLKKNGN